MTNDQEKIFERNHERQKKENDRPTRWPNKNVLLSHAHFEKKVCLNVERENGIPQKNIEAKWDA